VGGTESEGEERERERERGRPCRKDTDSTGGLTDGRKNNGTTLGRAEVDRSRHQHSAVPPLDRGQQSRPHSERLSK